MTKSILNRLFQWLESKPLILLRFEDAIGAALKQSRRGLSRFTIVEPHEEYEDLKLPTLCLAEIPEGATCRCYVGIVTSKEAVATLESRLTIMRLQQLQLKSLSSLIEKLPARQFQNALKKKLSTKRFADCLSPKLSEAIVKKLAKNPKNKRALAEAAFSIPQLRKRTNAEWSQADAIKLAVTAFGLSVTDAPTLVEFPDGSDSELVHLQSHVLEDNVIARDASVIPGFSLMKKYATGRAIFEKGNERLEVYTANKGPLEEMLGVDLIYINDVVGNTLMVQYKMLKPHRERSSTRTDWIFRPDPQLRKEIARMKLPKVSGAIDDYRLNRGPFYFKFVRRKGDGESHQSFVVSLDHLNEILTSSKSRGPKKGIRVSYDALGGAYLRETDLVGLIRSGYIGTHRVESKALNPIIDRVASGDRALVLAWQKRVN